MKGLKNFDFFQKIAVDNVSQPTIIGSLLSLSAISLMVFLLLREVVDLFTPKLTRDTIVYHDPDQRAQISANLAIKFPNVPCHMLSVDQEDSIGNHKMDISDTLKKIKIGGDGKAVTQQQVSKGFHDVGSVVKAITDGESCIISGAVPIQKVPGDIHISHHNYADIFEYLRGERKDLFAKISLSHQMYHLSFGDRNITSEIMRRFGMEEDDTFNTLKKLPQYTNDGKKYNYDYFLKLIPHVFEDKVRGETFMGYKYSITTRQRDYNNGGHEMPIVILHYDFSPVTMKLTLQSKSFMHSLTHICAIVGGIYVIFSILNRILLTFCEFSTQEKKGVAAIN